MLSIDLGIGLTSIAVAVRQATNYATTWSFAAYAQANAGALPGPWADVRRTGTATYENASGVITTLPDLGGGTYAARVQYRSGTARGLLNEGQTTNLLRYSEDFSNAAWARLGTTEVVNSIAAPDGASTADKLTDTSSSTTARFTYQTLTKSASSITYTLSAFVKAAEYGIVNLLLGNGSQYYGKSISLSDGALTTVSGSTTFTFVSATRAALGNGWYRVSLTCTSDTNTSLLAFIGQTSTAGSYDYAGTAGSGLYVWGAQVEVGASATSYIPTVGSAVVRAGDFAGVFLTGSALSAAFPGGVTAPWTTVFQYRKGYSVSSDETLFALSAGSSAGSTNLLALQVNGTQAQAVHSGGTGTLSGTLVHDGSTVNKIALSVDPVSGKVSVSVNGAAAVETTGIAFTGSGTTHLIPGARTTGGDTPVAAMEIYDWRNVNTAYTTGSALQALSA